jgi:hypothetical protein
MHSSHQGTRRFIFYLILVVMLMAVAGLFEGALRYLTRMGIVVLDTERPTTKDLAYWAEVSPHWGVWHLSNAYIRHKKSCFDVSNQSNSYGARDKERAKASTEPRIVVIGDSFVEGVGVQEGARFTNLLEDKTGVEHLNFGTSGGFGSIQEWQLYENLAKGFDHHALFIFFLPDNDFRDNRPDEKDGRYRPLLRKLDSGAFELYFSRDKPAAQERDISSSEIFYNRVYNGSYILRMAHEATVRLMDRLTSQNPSQGAKPTKQAGYRDYSTEDLDQLLYSYKQMVIAAGSKPVYIFMIPRAADLQLLENEPYESFKLPDALRAFAGAYKNVQFIDLLPYFRAAAATKNTGLKAFFHSCDGHWNEAGHKLVEGIVTKSAKPLYTSIKAKAP